MTNKEARVEFRLANDLKEKGQKLADSKGISLGGLFRMLLIQELDKESQKSINMGIAEISNIVAKNKQVDDNVDSLR